MTAARESAPDLSLREKYRIGMAFLEEVGEPPRWSMLSVGALGLSVTLLEGEDGVLFVKRCAIRLDPAAISTRRSGKATGDYYVTGSFMGLRVQATVPIVMDRDPEWSR